MIDFFKEEQVQKAKTQYKKTLLVYWIVLGAYVLLSAGMIIWYTSLPYKSETISLVKLIHYLSTCVFVIFSFIYLGIPVKRAKSYYKMTNNLILGLKESSIGNFFEYNNSLQVKDGVDFKSLIFLEWNKFKKDYYERKVLVFAESEFPKFKENESVKYVTQGNVLISYEILEEGEEQ